MQSRDIICTHVYAYNTMKKEETFFWQKTSDQQQQNKGHIFRWILLSACQRLPLNVNLGVSHPGKTFSNII